MLSYKVYNTYIIKLFFILVIVLMPYCSFAQVDDASSQDILKVDQLQPPAESTPTPVETSDQVQSVPALDQQQESTPVKTTTSSTQNQVPQKPVFTSDQQNIISSIKISSDYDLLLWADGLGLTTARDRSSLQAVLLKFYNLPDNALAEEKTTTSVSPSTTSQVDGESVKVDVLEKEVASGKADEIIIKKTNTARYFTYEKIQENVFVLQGNVEIIINQRAEKRQHIILADKLIYNETLRTGTALGDVVYKVYEFQNEPQENPTGDTIEEFDSQILSFNIDDFNSNIIIGNTITEKEVKYGTDNKYKEKLLFRIYSPYITRSKEKVITVSNASFTSSKAVPPLYKIKLKRMWLLTPEEWAIDRASIYVGEIPLLWLPFFVNPGDKFFFHPSIGFKTRTGAFINTTTYFIGEYKPASDADDEFLNLFNFSKQKIKQKIIKGLFLKEIEPGDKVKTYPTGWELRYLLDYYTGLGGYTAVEAKFPKLWILNNLEVNYGMAISQTVYNSENIYFNYYIDDQGKYQTYFDKGYLFNIEIPFRFKFSVKSGMAFSQYYNTSLTFEQHSDSFLDRDFNQRSFDYSWNQLLDPNNKIKELNKRESQKSSYYWQWNNNITIPTSQWVGNYIRSIGISNFKYQMNWSRKTLATADKPEEYFKGPGSVEEEIESYFFYPSQVEFPSYQLKTNGTLFTLDTKNINFLNGIKLNADKQKTKEEKQKKIDAELYKTPEYNLDSPVELPLIVDEKNINNNENSLEFPEFTPPTVTEVIWDWSQITYTIGYSVSHNLNEIIYYNENKWIKPTEIDILDPNYINYGYLTSDTSLDMNNDISLFGNWITYRYTLKLDLKYRHLNYADNLTEANKLTQERNANNYTKEELSNIHTLNIYPLKWLTVMSASSFSYTANHKLANNVFSSVEIGEWYEFDVKKWWNQHQFAQKYTLDYGGINQNWKWDIGLPPLSISYAYGYDISMKYFNGSVSTKIIENQETQLYEYDPLNASATIKFFDNKLNFTQTMVYEYEKINNNDGDYFDSLISTLNVWWFRSVFTMQYDYEYKFDNNSFTFIIKDGNDKQLRYKTWNNSFNYTSEKFYFWKNRINFSFNTNLTFNYDFVRFTNTTLSMSYGISFSVYKYLTFTFSSSFKNDVIYTYIQEFADQLNIPARDFWEDVRTGLAIGDEATLRKSAFKVGSINFGIVQDLGGWVLNFIYKGEPKRVTENNVTNYKWNNTIEISVNWKPLPQFKSEAFLRDEKWSLEQEKK